MQDRLKKFRAWLTPGTADELHFYQDQTWEFSPAERGIIPGAPPTPGHPTARRIVYALTSVLVGITGGLSNAMVIANLPYLQGSLGLNLSEIAWLPAAYLITNAIAGCALIKYRQQFGIRSFCMIFLGLYAAIIFAHLFVDDLASAIMVRAASGVAGSALTALGVFYMIQAIPLAHRPRAVVLGIGVPQLALPIARLLPVDMLAIDSWRGLYLFELGLALLTLAAVMFVRLPPNKRVPAFEMLDLVVLLLYACGIAAFGAAVGVGSYYWWHNADWIGWLLAASLPCLAVGAMIEYFRARPLIDIRWLSGRVLLRFALVSIAARIVLSEQNTGAIGLLRDFGLTNGDFRSLSLYILLASIGGVTFSALAVGPTRLTGLVMLAIGLVAVGAFIDSSAGMNTRAPQLIYTQMLIAFATTMFIGPSFVFGLSRVLADGGTNMTSFIAMFGITQSMGSLIGSAIIQTYLLYSQQYHLDNFASELGKHDPLVAANIAALANNYSSALPDASLRTSEGVAQLGQQVQLYARVAAYDDVFLMIAALAAFTTIFLLAVILWNWWTGLRTREMTP